MNGMKTCRHVATIASLLSLPCILACSSAGPHDESNPESQISHAVLFEAKWSDTGRFQILNDESGHMGMAVTGINGKDDPHAVGKLVGPSFVDTYRSLLPNKSVPPLLEALEARRSHVVASTDDPRSGSSILSTPPFLPRRPILQRTRPFVLISRLWRAVLTERAVVPRGQVSSSSNAPHDWFVQAMVMYRSLII
jgi:hypothetical protein